MKIWYLHIGVTGFQIPLCVFSVQTSISVTTEVNKSFRESITQYNTSRKNREACRPGESSGVQYKHWELNLGHICLVPAWVNWSVKQKKSGTARQYLEPCACSVSQAYHWNTATVVDRFVLESEMRGLSPIAGLSVPWKVSSVGSLAARLQWSCIASVATCSTLQGSFVISEIICLFP
jgi:hypothetical protein